MFARLKRLKLPQARSVVASLSLLALTVGLGMERLSLALIVPGALVFGCLAWSHVRGTPGEPSKAELYHVGEAAKEVLVSAGSEVALHEIEKLKNA